jgi:hypothetical protein
LKLLLSSRIGCPSQSCRHMCAFLLQSPFALSKLSPSLNHYLSCPPPSSIRCCTLVCPSLPSTFLSTFTVTLYLHLTPSPYACAFCLHLKPLPSTFAFRLMPSPYACAFCLLLPPSPSAFAIRLLPLPSAFALCLHPLPLPSDFAIRHRPPPFPSSLHIHPLP